jgi:hypothetical protein
MATGTSANTGNNVILVRTAMISLLIALVLAWCLVLGKGYKFPPLVAIFTDNQKLLSAHLDYLMMTMLLLGFNATRVPLPSYVVWLIAIGSIGNPTVFLLMALGPKTHLTELWLFTTASITITTAGYGMAVIRFIRSTLPRSA